MKTKSRRRLVLAKTTLRTLSTSELTAAVGGLFDAAAFSNSCVAVDGDILAAGEIGVRAILQEIRP